MHFEFATAHRILFGPGTIRQAAPWARSLGKRCLFTTGRHPERAASLLTELKGQGIECRVFPVAGEPTVVLAQSAVADARGFQAEFIVGFGGGSAIDMAKAVAALCANDGDPLDYLETVGRGLPLARPALPVMAIPTTAGTGSEGTRNAVLASPDHGAKASLRDASMLPRIAIVDPELTLDLPAAVTASTGLDALTQLIEPFTSRRANPLTDAFCREGIGRVVRSLRVACTDGHQVAAREDMALASLFGGMALANAGLGAVHGIAGPAGGMRAAPHGMLCAALLPHVMAANLIALRAAASSPPALERFAEVARLVTGRSGVTPEDGVAWLRNFVRELGIPGLRTMGFSKDELPALADKSLAASSMKANPVSLSRAQVIGILEQAW